MRRLLENGANSSFVNQIVDKRLAPEAIAADPIAAVEGFGDAIANPGIRRPAELFAPRRNSRGWNVNEPASIAAARSPRASPGGAHRWQARRRRAGRAASRAPVVNPADPTDIVGEVAEAAPPRSRRRSPPPQAGFADWSATPAAERAAALRRAADLYEANAPELTALATREAGKTLADAIAEVREAVDFLRYYADAGRGGRRPPRAASWSASARGTSRWRSSPARSPPASAPATPSSPSPPSRRR